MEALRKVLMKRGIYRKEKKPETTRAKNDHEEGQ